MGQSHPGPAGVTITNYGDDAQQKTCLPEFAGESVPQAVIVNESRAVRPFIRNKEALGSDIIINLSRPWSPTPVPLSCSSSPSTWTV